MLSTMMTSCLQETAFACDNSHGMKKGWIKIDQLKKQSTNWKQRRCLCTNKRINSAKR